MGVLKAVTGLLEASSSSSNRGTGDDSTGAYWCDDCGERIRDVDVEGETPPSCPGCGEPMTFERSAASRGCAC